MKKIIVNVIRVIFAGVFLFSGFVKAIDPLGFTYKMQDYLTAFGGFWEMFTILAFPMSIFLSALEFWIGFNILFGIYRKQTTILGILMMAMMTPLTLYVAIFNPVTDCGCFGDALVIDNWTTFYKNIFFSAFAVILFIWRAEMPPLFSKKSRWFVSAYAFVFIVALSIYCYRNLPIIDFRPYKIGNNILEGMQIPEGAPRDSFRTVFVYEKDGIRREFEFQGMNVVDIATGETTDFTAFAQEWTFVDQNSKLIRKGFEPPIHNFSITTLEDGDITQDVLTDPNYTFLLISYKLERASLRDSARINRIFDFARENGYRFYCLNASLYEDVEDFIQLTGAKFPMARTDAVTLKTIIRSNPGLVLIKDGTIINKWHHRNLPVFDKPLAESELGQIPAPTAIRNTIIALSILFVPVFVLMLVGLLFCRKKEQ